VSVRLCESWPPILESLNNKRGAETPAF